VYLIVQIKFTIHEAIIRGNYAEIPYYNLNKKIRQLLKHYYILFIVVSSSFSFTFSSKL